MAKIPTCGWFHVCEDCDIITSRLAIVKHNKKKKAISLCHQCRMGFIGYLLEDFNTVVIQQESSGELFLVVY